MARRALAAAALAALTLTTATLVVDNDVLATSTWGQHLGYSAQGQDPDDESVDPTTSADLPDDVRSSRRPQSGGPGAVRIPDLLAPVLPAPDTEGGGDGGGAGGAGDGLLAAPLSAIGNLLFASGFEDGLGDWGRHDSQGSIDIVNSPVREGRSAVRLTAQDNGGDNVRTQLDGPTLFEEGTDSYIGFSSYFPSSNAPVPGWFVFFEFHGPPFNGSPLPGAFAIGDFDGQQRIKFGRSAQYNYDVPWTMPMVHDRWVDFVIHVKFSKDESVGFIELWVDGQRQQFTDGSQRLYQSTIMSDQDEGLYPIATNYYEGGTIDQPMVVYHDAIRVGGSYGSAAPAGG